MQIHKLSLGICNCYLLKQDGLILVDAGPPNQVNKLSKKLQEQLIKPQDISLMLVTHGHWDHIGSINEIKVLTGC